MPITVLLLRNVREEANQSLLIAILTTKMQFILSVCVGSDWT